MTRHPFTAEDIEAATDAYNSRPPFPFSATVFIELLWESAVARRAVQTSKYYFMADGDKDGDWCDVAIIKLPEDKP